MQEGDKLYIITRRDLLPGIQLAQALHALMQFTVEHQVVAAEWHQKSNYIAALSTVDEPSLEALLEKARERGLRCSLFREPDRDNELTAIAIEPGKASQRLCSGLPLALKSHAHVQNEPFLPRNTT